MEKLSIGPSVHNKSAEKIQFSEQQMELYWTRVASTRNTAKCWMEISWGVFTYSYHFKENSVSLSQNERSG